MSIPPEKIAELRVKHLEMVQAIVSRMAGYGASFKSYCITITTAVCGFAVTLHRPGVAALSLLAIFAFALVDAQYLRVERRFRALYDRLRGEGWGSLPDFAIDLKSAPSISYWPVLGSWSIISFYGPLAALVIMTTIAGRLIDGHL
jgi:hypothetical protein